MPRRPKPSAAEQAAKLAREKNARRENWVRVAMISGSPMPTAAELDAKERAWQEIYVGASRDQKKS